MGDFDTRTNVGEDIPRINKKLEKAAVVKTNQSTVKKNTRITLAKGF